jgi:hypothetical protein
MSQLQVTGEAKVRDIQGPVVANSGVITALDGAASQYVRGDGTLADFPTSSGGGSSVSYYLNSSVSQGTIGGVAYRELSKDPIIGGGTDIAISANGYVANYITDVNDPDVTIVPGGNFNCEFYFSVNNNTGNPTTYAELYKYDGTTFTLLGSNVGVPESINQGTTIAPYYFAIPVATASLALTDRLAIRIYVNVSGRTVTLHTENGHLCQVVTTLSKGMVSLNNLTDQSQFITTGTAGTNFAIVSSGDTHTFNLPVASATNTGKLSSTDWSTFNNKLSTATADATYVSISDTQTVDGFKTFSNPTKNDGGISLKNGASYSGSGYMNLGGLTDGLRFTSGAGISNYFTLPSLVGYTYTFPAATGTIALTSDISYPVTSVFGRTGAVIAVSGDYNTSQVTELTNLYFTDARSRAALSFEAGSGAYNSTTGVITVPTNTNQLTNGASFITLTSLSGGTGITYNNTTGVITNSAPDQTVSLSNGAGISVTGTYPSFTIASTITQYTDALARAAISLTTTGTSGAATYNSTTGVFNIPNYAPDLSGYVTLSTAQTITGKKTFSNAFGNGDPILVLTGTSSDSFQYATTTYNASLSAGHTIAHFIGRASSSRMSAYIGYQYAAADSNSNFLSLGHFNYDHLIKLYPTGQTIISGNVSAANLSGTNTGDQTLAGLGGQAQLNGTGFVKATGTTISYDNSTYLTSGFDTSGTLFARTAMTTYRDHSASAANDAPIKSLSGSEDNWIYLDAANAQWGIYHRNIDTPLVVAGQPTLPANSIAFIGANEIASYVNLSNGNGFFRGSLSASNFSGSSSGTNTGDQDLSGYLTTASASATYLPLIGGTLTGRLTINVTNNYGVLMNRPAITNYIGLQYSTAATNQWFVGMRENSTNNYIVYNEVLETDAFTISRTNNIATFAGAYGSQAGLMLSGTTYGCIGAQRGASSAAAGMNYFSVGVQKWFAGIYENTDNFGFYSGSTGTFPFTITPNGLVTFTRNESSYGMIRLKGSSVEASIGYGFPADTDATTWVVGKGAGLGDTTFGWYYGGVKMILTTGGNLLVNTPTGVSGGGALQVNGDVNINGNFKINGTIIGGGGGSGVTGSGTNGYITKWTGASTLGNSVLYESGSNVGIGTTSTAEKLVVNGNIISYPASSAWAEGLSFIVPTVSTWGGLRWRRERSGYDGNWGIGYVGFDSTDDLVFISNNAGSQINNILRLTKIGNVLVNTGTDNGSKFQVSGTATFSSTVTAAGGFFDTSDSRLKIVINDYNETKGIEKVPARLYLKNNKRELGYFAQDLQEILPSAVIEGTDGFLTLSYSQVHTAKIAYLEKEVAELKELIKTLL